MTICYADLKLQRLWVVLNVDILPKFFQRASPTKPNVVQRLTFESSSPDVVSWTKQVRLTRKIRDILFRREYDTQFGSPTNINNLSRIC